MNRHGIANLLMLVGFLVVLVVTTGIIWAAFTLPSTTMNLLDTLTLVAAVLVWFGMMFGAIFLRERIHEWLYHRYELSDQSPSNIDA